MSWTARARATCSLVALVSCLVIGRAAPAQDAAVPLESVLDATHATWVAADGGLREARRSAATARAAHQVQLKREEALQRAPWWMPRFVVAAQLEEVRRAAHEAAAAVVEAEHRVEGAAAQERVTRLLYAAAAGDWLEHLSMRGDDVAAIASAEAVVRLLEARRDVLDPPPPAAAPTLDAAALAKLSAVQLEELELTFEELALDAERRRAALAPLRARAERLVRVLERRVLDQAAAGLDTALANRRAERDRLVAWVDAEAARASACRRHVREFEAAREAVERRERAARRAEGLGQ